jgi:uracil phosphoribosyltransferase
MTVAVHLVEHPLIADSLTRVRDKDTPNALFRQELERIGTLLIAEATRGLLTREVRVTTPLVTTTGRTLSSRCRSSIARRSASSVGASIALSTLGRLIVTIATASFCSMSRFS